MNAAKLLHDAGANVKAEQCAERSSKKENSKKQIIVRRFSDNLALTLQLATILIILTYNTRCKKAFKAKSNAQHTQRKRERKSGRACKVSFT